MTLRQLTRPTTAQFRVLAILAASGAWGDRAMGVRPSPDIVVKTFDGLIARGLIDRFHSTSPAGGKRVKREPIYSLTPGGLAFAMAHMSCRRCGCTQEQACPGGCYWAEPFLCSACMEASDG